MRRFGRSSAVPLMGSGRWQAIDREQAPLRARRLPMTAALESAALMSAPFANAQLLVQIPLRVDTTAFAAFPAQDAWWQVLYARLTMPHRRLHSALRKCRLRVRGASEVPRESVCGGGSFCARPTVGKP